MISRNGSIAPAPATPLNAPKAPEFSALSGGVSVRGFYIIMRAQRERFDQKSRINSLHGKSLNEVLGNNCTVVIDNLMLLKLFFFLSIAESKFKVVYVNNTKIWILFAMSAYSFDEPKFTSAREKRKEKENKQNTKILQNALR